MSQGRRADNRYTIRGDLEPQSFWLVTTPSAIEREQPYLCTEAGTLFGRRHFLTERRGKESHLVVYTFGGAGLVRQGTRSVTVRHGQVLLMDCRIPQSYGTAPEADHWHHLWAHVEGVGVDAAARRLGLPALTPLFVSRSRVQPHFDTIFELLETESIENGELVSMAVHALMSEAIMAKARAEVPADDPVALAREYVRTHFAERIAVEDMARAACVSPSYLNRLFRQSLGTSPHDFLTRHRITRAKQLLAETDLSMAEIASRTGLGSASNFSYRFSAATGVSPRAYRDLTRGDPGDQTV